MSYVTTGSSNTVTSGSPIHINIRISRDPQEAIFLMGAFTLKGLAGIATSESLRGMTCVLYGKLADDDDATAPVKIVAFPYDDSNPDQRSIILNRHDIRQYTYLDLKIEADVATMTASSTILELSFYDKNNTDTSGDPKLNVIDFEVHKVQAHLKIASFTANPLVLQARDKPVTLNWELHGDTYTYRLLEGLTVLKTGSGSHIEKGIFSTIPPIGDHVYTIEATQGDTVVTKDIKVRVLGKSEVSSGANPMGYVVGNFCASQDSSALFGLMLAQDGDAAKIDHVGYNMEGFSQNWRRLELSDADKEQLKPFANSPMIHLKNVGETFGRILFIGGSYVKPFACANAVAIINLEAETDKVNVTKELPWDARMGHSCTLFPHGDVEKIWLMGGVDEYGGTLDDIWVSGNGTHWENVNASGAVQAKNMPAAMPWKARCLAGITTQLDDRGNKKSLWFGGGFDEIGGFETPDIWKFEDRNWTQLHWSKTTPFAINNKSYLSSGLGFIGVDTIEATGVAIMGGYQDKYAVKNGFFNKIEIQQNGFFNSSSSVVSAQTDSFNTIDNAYVVTAFFKGSLWFMIYTNAGDLGITYSYLYYWIPVVTSRTLILS